jgi:glycosyltransferase involved in cell wall biosynthesis
LSIIVGKIFEADVLDLDLEVLIIDDASQDRSPEIAERLIQE